MAKGDFRQSWERVAEGPKPEGPPVYTPTTEEVRVKWAEVEEWVGGEYLDTLDTHLAAQFDRWLASVRADAWDEGVQSVYD